MTEARGWSDADAGALASNGREDVRGAGRRAVDGGGCGGGEQKGSFLKDKMEGMKVSESPAAGGSGFEDHGCECTVYFDDVRTLEGFTWQSSNICNRLAEKQCDRLKKVQEKR